MTLHKILWLTIVTLVLTSLACNAFVGNQRPAFGPPPTSVAESSVVATSEMAATATLAADGQQQSATVTMLVDLNPGKAPNYMDVSTKVQPRNVREF